MPIPVVDLADRAPFADAIVRLPGRPVRVLYGVWRN